MSTTEPERDGWGIMARLGEAVEALTRSHDHLSSYLQRPPPAVVYRPVSMAGPASSGGFVAFDLGGPDLGRVWHVRNLVVGGQTPATVAAGKADVFASAVPPGIGGPQSGDQPGSPGFYSPTGFTNGSLLNWRDTAATLPNVAFYSVGDLVVPALQDLWVVISGGTSGQVYQVAGIVEDQEEAAYRTVRL